VKGKLEEEESLVLVNTQVQRLRPLEIRGRSWTGNAAFIKNVKKKGRKNHREEETGVTTLLRYNVPLPVPAEALIGGAMKIGL